MRKPGSKSSLNPSHLPDTTQVGVAAEFPQDPARILYPTLTVTGTETYNGDTYTASPAFPHESEFEESYVGPSGFFSHSQIVEPYTTAETQASSSTLPVEPYGPPGSNVFSRWGHAMDLAIATPTSDPSISTPSTQIQPTLRALSRPQPYPLSRVREVFAFTPIRNDEVGRGTAMRIGVIRVSVLSHYQNNSTNFVLDRRGSICYRSQY